MPDPGDPNQQNEETLAALHGLSAGNSDESEHDDADPEEDPQLQQAESRDDPGASSAASGFVGMLAKEGAAGSPGALPGTPGPTPSAKSRPDAIHMARELNPDELPPSYRSPTAARTKKPAKTVPGWYHGAMPVMFTMGAVLLLIGVWAVGGLLYMAATKANENSPAYPLIQRELNDDTTGIPTYTDWSKGGAAALSLCVPVAVAMEIMAMMMLKQIGAAKRSSKK